MWWGEGRTVVKERVKSYEGSGGEGREVKKCGEEGRGEVWWWWWW